jgi:hypothetical protein
MVPKRWAALIVAVILASVPLNIALADSTCDTGRTDSPIDPLTPHISGLTGWKTVQARRHPRLLRDTSLACRPMSQDLIGQSTSIIPLRG